jgi:uncharacterized membrane protein
VRLVLAVLVLLVAGLLAQAIFDSAIGAWIAFAVFFVLLAMRLLGLTGAWPADWPDSSDGDG